MSVILSEKDKELLVAMKQLGVLEDINPNLLQSTEGAVIVMCGDGDHACDKASYFFKLLEQCGSKVRPHLLTENGGGIWLPHSPLLRRIPFPQASDYLLWKIATSLEMKRMRDVFLCVHSPCGAAREFDLSVYDVVKYNFEGKDRLKSEIPKLLPSGYPQVRVHCFLHEFDHTVPSKPRKTRFINRSKWDQNRVHLAQYDDTPEASSVSA